MTPMDPHHDDTAREKAQARALGIARDDVVVPFAVEALDARGRVVRLGSEISALLERHDYPAPVKRLLGEMVVLTALLGSSLKFNGRFIVQTQTEGPVRLLVVDYHAAGHMRAMARFDAEAIEDAADAGRLAPEELLGQGILAMTVDNGPHMDRYQGIVQLEGQSLEDVAHRYFEQSEQIPTMVRLAVGEEARRDAQGQMRHGWRAGGVLLQFLPDNTERIQMRDLHPGDAPDDHDHHEVEEDDAWTQATAYLATLSDEELLDADLGADRLLFRLFHEPGVRAFEALPLISECSCSQDRIDTMVANFTDEERDEMSQDGQIVITCEFCSRVYTVAHEA